MTNGATANTFEPNAQCSRAQYMTFLFRAVKGTGSASASAFGDVAPGAYYYDAVSWAVENGVTKGTSATTFSPDATCSRAEMVTFLYRVCGK